MLIAIDHGNKNIKTKHRTFTAGLLASDYAAYGGETVKFAGQYYTLTDRRGGYRRDKTEDEDYYVLTLFALAYEIEACGAYEPDAYIEVDLAVGVPPTDYGMLAERYKAYFAKNEYVDFEKDGKPYHVWIRSVSVYVQGWAALMPRFAAVKDEGKATLIDVGGYTAIYMVLHNGQPDFAACEALDNGMLFLYRRVINKVKNACDTILDEQTIDSVLRGDRSGLPWEIADMVEKETARFVADLLNRLRENGVDLKTGLTCFAGGGAILLQKYIEAHGDKIFRPYFIGDINANVQGYEYLFQIENEG